MPTCTSNRPKGVRRTATTDMPSKRVAKRSPTARSSGSSRYGSRVDTTRSGAPPWPPAAGRASAEAPVAGAAWPSAALPPSVPAPAVE